MNGRDAIKVSIGTAQMICLDYLRDLTDTEMMHRPHPEINHIKWQVGHLITSERMMVEGVAPGAMPPLPDGFADRYTKETAASDDAAGFDSKAELLQTFEQQRAATLAAIDGLSDEDLDQAAPESMRDYAPNVGAVFNMQGAHWLMHAGQWAVIRRQLDRPPLY